MGASDHYAVTVDQNMPYNLTPPPTPPRSPSKNSLSKMASNERKESLQNGINHGLHPKREMDDIRKDLLLLAASITLLYLGMGSIEDIQRGLNDSRALSLTIRGLFIITKMASCVCLPSFLIHRLGCKLALIWAFCIHLIYLLASLDPRFSTMLVCSSAAGFMNPVLWTSIGIYVTKMAVVFSRQAAATPSPMPTEAVINKFFAIFFCVISSAFVVGSLVASTVLNPKVDGRITSDETFTCGAGYCNEPLKVVRECADIGGIFKGPNGLHNNGTLPMASALSTGNGAPTKIKVDGSSTVTSSIARPTPKPIIGNSLTSSPRPTPSTTVFKIGINATIHQPPAAPPTQNPSPLATYPPVNVLTPPPPPPTVQECPFNLFKPPPAESVYIVGGLYVAFGFGGFLIVIFLVRTLGASPPPPFGDDEPLTRSLFNFVGSNFGLLKEYPMLLLLVLTTFGYGIVDYFFIYDYPKAYIVCIVGHHYVGFLSFCVGLLAMLSALSFIWVHVFFCRLWMTLASTGLACICLLSLFFWKPHPDTKGVAFFLSLLWGIVNAIWNIQLYSIHGHLGYSKLESSFSNLIFWWSAGHLFGFIWSELVCIYFKLYIMVTFLFLASGAVVVLELILNAPHKKITQVLPKPGSHVASQAKPEGILNQYKSKVAAAGPAGPPRDPGTNPSFTADRTKRDRPLPASNSVAAAVPLASAPEEGSMVMINADSPIPKHETPLPVSETPLGLPASETPIPVHETPIPVHETPIPVHETPFPLSDTPLPISNGPTPEPVSDTPLPVRETSAVPMRATPLQIPATPLPQPETPFSIRDTPLPSHETPLPNND